MKDSRAARISVIVSVSAISLFAQASGSSETILLAMAANTKRMVQYQWKQRITVTRKGKPAQPVVDQVSFDPEGGMRRTTIAGPEQMSGIRGRVAAGVRQEVKDVMDLVGRYNQPQQMVSTIKKAQITQNAGDDTIQLQAKDVIKPGDDLTMLVNAGTHLAKHIQISTDFDGGPMSVAQDFSAVPGGPNVMKSMKISVPKKDLVIDVASYDFAQQAAPGSGQE